MMRKLIALAIAATFVLVLPTIAAATGRQKSRPHVNGTITSWDDATKQGTVKDAAGKETSISWNEKTQFTGTPQIGDHAFVSYTQDKDGKVWAKYVSVGTNPTWRSTH